MFHEEGQTDKVNEKWRSKFGEKQIRYVSGGTCLKYFSPLEKSSTPLEGGAEQEASDDP